jgi:hypothetical protein
VQQLTDLLRRHEIESKAHGKEFSRLLQLREADAAERLAAVEKLTSMVMALEADRQKLREQIQSYTQWLEDAQQENKLITEAHRKAEKDATERLAAVEKLTAHVMALEADRQKLREQIQSYDTWLKDAKRDHQLVTTAHRSAEQAALALQTKIDEQNRLHFDEVNKLTAQATVRLHRNQFETSLSNQMLGLSATLPVFTPARWIQLPLPALVETPHISVVSNLELVERKPNFIRICGWAFADDAKAVSSESPYLVFQTTHALWMLRGVTVERKDVAEAFPVAAAPFNTRLRCGFVFEFHPSQLPSPSIKELHVVFGQVTGMPVTTPAFSLT